MYSSVLEKTKIYRPIILALHNVYSLLSSFSCHFHFTSNPHTKSFPLSVFYYRGFPILLSEFARFFYFYSHGFVLYIKRRTQFFSLPLGEQPRIQFGRWDRRKFQVHLVSRSWSREKEIEEWKESSYMAPKKIPRPNIENVFRFKSFWLEIFLFEGEAVTNCNDNKPP